MRYGAPVGCGQNHLGICRTVHRDSGVKSKNIRSDTWFPKAMTGRNLKKFSLATSIPPILPLHRYNPILIRLRA